MDFFPIVELTIFGGWLFPVAMGLTQFITLSLVSREMRTKLLDRSDFTRDQKIMTVISKSISLVVLVLLFFTPLSAELAESVAGIIVFILGMIFEVVAVLDYIKTPVGEPVTRGLFKISRNPQEVSLTVAILGASIAVGSWTIMLLLLLSRVFNHIQILAQERSCLLLYGDSYKQYMKEVPRYFLFF